MNLLVEKLTPVEKYGSIYIKRDDLFEIAGVRGGKVRSCYALAKDAKIGLTTAGSRSSPQINIVASIAKHLNLPCVAHCPQGELNKELLIAQSRGAKIIQHRAGYNSVIVARSKEYAFSTGYTDIPFGMECWTAVWETAGQVVNIPGEVKRIVMPVGGGMSLCGVLTGLKALNKNIPVLGIVVGGDPMKRIHSYAPLGYQEMVTLQNAGVPYDKYIDAEIGGIKLDPVYEAK